MLPVNTQILPSKIPTDSQIARVKDSAYFFDAYAFKTKSSHLTSLEIWLSHMSTVPTWINILMRTRNKMVSMLGLKDLGALGDINPNKAISDYQVGDKIGIFTLKYISDDEIILMDYDKHLDVFLSVYKVSQDSQSITISTVVHVHNWLGKVYMLVVAPLHKIIVPASIKRAEFS